MADRFKREKNLSRRHTKKDISVPEKNEKASKINREDDVTPLVHISEVYTDIQSRGVVRDTLLLGCVLFVLLFCAGWAMPRVFSFHIDLSHIAQNIIP